MAVVVDLITPPGSPVGARAGTSISAPTGLSSQNSIDLCTPPASPRQPLAPLSNTKPDANNEAASAPLAPVNAKPTTNEAASAKALGKRKAEPAPPADANALKAAKEETSQVAPLVNGAPVEDADEVLETSAPPAPVQNDVHEKRDDDDDDVTCTGRTGANALSDFPHARENCVAVRFVQGQESKCCNNCYCYVCDAPAKDCPEWSEHCKASHRSAAWQQRRAQWKARQSAPAPARPRAVAPSAGQSSWMRHLMNGQSDSDEDPDVEYYDSGGLNQSGKARWSCVQMLKEIEQVYPEEQAEPKGFAAGMTLRPYQRQSLAFMINVERSTDATLQGQQTFSVGKHRNVDGTMVRGGWLVDEMGMGKTAVCAALALATRGQGKTVVICNNTLVGQWMDELKKFGPGLKVCKHYGGMHGASWKTADVIVTTPATVIPKQEVEGGGRSKCYRLILDESHLYEHGADPKLPTSKMFQHVADNSVPHVHYSPDIVWCVTGTPFSHSLAQLEMQARLVGHWTRGLKVKDMLLRCEHTCSGQHCGWDAINHKPRLAITNQQVADTLKQVMIRHSKSQRIQGEEALALPDSEVATVWLTMSEDERLLYDLASCADGIPKWADVNRVTEATLTDLSRGLSKRRGALAQTYVELGAIMTAAAGSAGERGLRSEKARTAHARLHIGRGPLEKPGSRWQHRTKFRALKDDLSALCAAQPDVSVVIFTHHNSVLADVSEMLRKELSMTVFEVSRTTDPARRHTALRSFQSGATSSGSGARAASSSSGTGGGARAFCTTFATAAVGLTLTAASRVYLLEASLDPAQEAQAAGRIHRLGQTKEVLVRRFYFEDSLDEAVHSLHEKIQTGKLALDRGRFPRAALQLLRDHGVADPHQPDPNAPLVETQRRYRSPAKTNVARYGGVGGFDYGKTVQTRVCLRCGRKCEVAGTSVWWGKGRWLPLNGDTADRPAMIANMEPEDERDD